MASTTATPIELDAQGRIAADLTCLNCGYNLRGIALAERCPECGMAVQTSLREDRLTDAPVEWRRGLRRAATILVVGTILTLPLLYLGLWIATVGLWGLTRPQPGREEPMRDLRFRFIGRSLLLLGAAILFALVLTGIMGISRASGPPSLMGWQYVDAVFIAGNGLFMLGFLATLSYLEGLGQRIPDEALVGRIRWTRRAWIGGTAAIAGVAVIASVADYFYRGWGVYWVWATPILFGATALVLVWLWVVTLQFALALRRGIRVPLRGDR